MSGSRGKRCPVTRPSHPREEEQKGERRKTKKLHQKASEAGYDGRGPPPPQAGTHSTARGRDGGRRGPGVGEENHGN
ncbi:hypothetical protein LY76DRAFT_592396, partial [Colletotrichum caudatum]